jgi:hypothetical protein
MDDELSVQKELLIKYERHLNRLTERLEFE